MKLRAPSPALVISVIALLVALSATAYAATKITKSSQIKNGIITSADIKNSTIGTTDLSKSTLKRIDKGAAAASNAAAIEGVRKVGPLNQPANQLVKVATLTIPAGAYVISAKTTLGGIPKPPGLLAVGLGSADADCRLNAGGDEDAADIVIIIDNRQVPGTMYMQTTRTVGGSAAVTLTCASGSPWNATNTSIIAQRVGSTDKKEIGDS